MSDFDDAAVPAAPARCDAPKPPAKARTPKTLRDHRQRLADARAGLIEARERLVVGDAVLLADVERALVDVFTRVRARLLAIPVKLAPIVAVEDDAAEVQKLVSLAVGEALVELSTYEGPVG